MEFLAIAHSWERRVLDNEVTFLVVPGLVYCRVECFVKVQEEVLVQANEASCQVLAFVNCRLVAKAFCYTCYFDLASHVTLDLVLIMKN